jgi:hypothetical protein
MKIIQAGSLTFINGRLNLQDWCFDAEGKVPTVQDVARVAIAHVAKCFGLQLVTQAQLAEHFAEVFSRDRFDLASEREALDAIAIARWAGPPELRED